MSPLRLLPSLVTLLALTACADIPSEPTSPLTRTRAAASLMLGTSTTGVPFAAIGSFMEVSGMSDAGHIVGGYITEGQHRGYVWHEGNLTTLPTLGGGDSQALDVNSRGDVVGRSSSETANTLATLWRNAQPTSLGALSGSHSEARAINDAGSVVGFSSRSGRGLAPFIWTDGVMTELPTPAGNGGMANDINEKGWAVGWAWTADFRFARAVIWKDGVMTEIPSLGGPFAEAMGINENGDVVGYSMTPNGQTRAFLWTGGATITEIAFPGSTYSVAQAINDAGVVVGRASIGTSRAFMWANGELKDLGTAGSNPNAAAWDVNNLDQIAGNIGDFSGYWGFTPPQPADVTPPVITFTGAGTYTVDQTVSVTCSATDEDSGIQHADCPTLSGEASSMPLGTTTLHASATDNAGNTSTASASVTIVVDNASLAIVTGRCVAEKGILNSLQAKLRAGSINAYLHELKAQRGKKITADCADNLSRLAQALSG